MALNPQFENNPVRKGRSKKSPDYNPRISMPSNILVKAKLEMTKPGDADEREADEVADSIINEGKVARAVSSGHSGGGVALPSHFGNQIASFQGQGSCLYGGLKEQMESGFGRDFSDVRLHTDDAAAEMSDSISAKAFTMDNDIYFNRGQYAPETVDGQRLIAHELTHVSQGKGTLRRFPINGWETIPGSDTKYFPPKPSPIRQEWQVQEEDKVKKQDSLFSPEEILLLNMLTYIPEEKKTAFFKEGKTVGAIVDDILNNGNVNEWNDETISTTDWMNVFNSIKGIKRLSEVEIQGIGSDSLGGYCLLFISNSNKEIIVAFRGTAQNEWPDNFRGGSYTDELCAPSGERDVITDQQKQALSTYNRLLDNLEITKNDYTITVTGHSKGGNKAKFVALMNDNASNAVGRCLSFDGQGFSDEFMKQYRDLIDKNEGLITNYNADMDFVNLLLNDVGKTVFLFAQNFSTDSFKENHSPEILLNFNQSKDGNVSVRLAEKGLRHPAMIELDRFLNSFLRSLDAFGDEDAFIKTKTLSVVGSLVQKAMIKMSKGEEIDIKKMVMDACNDENDKDSMTYLLVFLVDYYDNHEGFKNALSLFGFDAFDIIKIKSYIGIKSFRDLVQSNFEYYTPYISYDGSDIETSNHDVFSDVESIPIKSVSETWVKENPEPFCELFVRIARIERGKLNTMERNDVLFEFQFKNLAERYANSIITNQNNYKSAAKEFLDSEIKRYSKSNQKIIKATFSQLGLY